MSLQSVDIPRITKSYYPDKDLTSVLEEFLDIFTPEGQVQGPWTYRGAGFSLFTEGMISSPDWYLSHEAFESLGEKYHIAFKERDAGLAFIINFHNRILEKGINLEELFTV